MIVRRPRSAARRTGKAVYQAAVGQVGRQEARGTIMGRVC